MKKQYLWIVLALLTLMLTSSLQAQEDLAPAGYANEYYFAPYPVAIAVDGDLSDWAVPTVTMPTVESETSIRFAAAADAEYLYIMGDITDPNIITGEHGENYWNEDSVEVYINGSGNLLLTSYDIGVAQITVPALNADLPPEEVVLAGVQGSSAEAEVHAFRTDTGWALEMSVPLINEVWAITPRHGGVIGFQVHLNSASTSNRDQKFIWSLYDVSDQSYLNPGVFGYLAFYEVGETGYPDVVATVAELKLPPEADPNFVPIDAPYKNPSLPIEVRVEDLLARMTIEEKIGQMTLVEKGSISKNDITDMGIGGLLSGGGGGPTDNTAAGWAAMVRDFQERALQSRLAIPLIYGVDAVHGHNNVYGAVVYPHNIGLGATRDPELVEAICRATAEEVAATGIYWDYSPVLAVPQDVRWGRTYEAYGEDTDLVSELSTACLRGLQGDGIGLPNTVLATPKHFVGDGGTVWGTSTTGSYQIDQGVTQVDEATLREIHLPPYQAAIDAGAMSVMISYSSWNDTKMHGEQYLITDVLKGEMGFEGFIVSDWQGIDQINPVNFYDSVVTSINAGVDMNMVPYNYNAFIDTMLQAVVDGDISVDRIDDAVRRILTVKFEMGLFEWAFAQSNLQADFGGEAHRALARQAVAESLVLLKNENEALPIGETTSIFVAGDGASDIGMQTGGWTISWQGNTGAITEGTTIIEGIEATASENTTVYFDRLGRFRNANDADGNPLQAEVGIVVIGELPYAEGVGDSATLELREIDINIINRVRERVDTLIVVLLSGRPVIITDHLAVADAFVAAWLPGTEGQGVADVLFGDVPFTGKLPYTWMRSVDQLPLNIHTIENEEDALFPFGYGLETE